MKFGPAISPITSSVVPLSVRELQPQSVFCDFRCFLSILSSFAERTFSGVAPLLSLPSEGKENCALAFLETYFKCFDIRILTEGLGVTRGQSLWDTIEVTKLWTLTLVFNLEFVTISCELAVTLGFPTLLPADNSQLSSFQRLLPYHQAVISLGPGFFSVIVWPWNCPFLKFLLSLKTRAVHGQFWAGEARALLRSLCKVWLTAWGGINSPHMELQMLYPYNCELYMQLLEQLLLLHHHWLSHICVCSALSKKKGEIPLIQLFK